MKRFVFCSQILYKYGNHMKYQSYKGQKDVKLLYFFAIVISFALFLIIYVIIQPTKEIFWKDYAATEYDATIITDSDGTQKLAVDISTPEQLAGIFTKEEKTYNLYQTSSSNAKIKIYLAKNVSEKDVKKYYFTTYDDHTSNDVATKLGNVYRLTKLLDLYGRSWIPADLSNGETFDGNGYTIHNLNISGDMSTVGFVQANYGIIKNLTVKITITSTLTCSSNSTRGYMGGICGKNYGIKKIVMYMAH